MEWFIVFVGITLGGNTAPVIHYNTGAGSFQTQTECHAALVELSDETATIQKNNRGYLVATTELGSEYLLYEQCLPSHPIED